MKVDVPYLAEFEGVTFQVIHLDDLITEKKAAGRHKDLDNLEHLIPVK